MGSPISKADLVSSSAKLTESVVLPLDEYDLHVAPPPGSGHVLGLIMNILREYRADFAAAQQLDALQIHRIVEAFKFGFVQRWQLDEAAEEQVRYITISLSLSFPLSQAHMPYVAVLVAFMWRR